MFSLLWFRRGGGEFTPSTLLNKNKATLAKTIEAKSIVTESVTLLLSKVFEVDSSREKISVHYV